MKKPFLPTSRMTPLLLLVFIISFSTVYAQPWAELVKDACSGSCNSYPSNLTVYNGMVYFTGYDAMHGEELWTTNGASANTQIVKDINPLPVAPGAGSGHPQAFCSINGKLIFRATKDQLLMNVWVTDGTQSGTLELGGGIQMESEAFMPFNQYAYFISNDGSVNPDIKDLWRTDGTNQGTQKVGYLFNSSMPKTNFKIAAYAINNNKLYFGIEDYKSLWITDGTAAGMTRINLNVAVKRMVAFQNKIYFIGDDYKLYKTDGTSAGTVMVSDFGDLPPKVVGTFHSVGNTLVVANRKIWKSNGTPSGTTAISSSLYGVAHTQIGNKIYYIAGGMGQSAYLTMTDLDKNTTVILDTMVTASSPRMILFQNKLYFEGMPISVAMGGTKTYGRRTLHYYDVTNSQMKSIPEITKYHTDFSFGIIGNEMIISANDSAKGYEVWKITDFPTSVTTPPAIERDAMIYPNPASDRLQMQLPKNETGTYTLMNLHGQILLYGTIQQKAEIDMARLPAGIYLVNITVRSAGTVVKRFVKQ